MVDPLALTGVSQLTMKNNANGNLIDKNGEPTNNIEEAVGSELVGQDFTEDYFFRGRVSSVNYNTYTEEQKENGEYTGVSSGSFNYAKSNPELEKRIQEETIAYLQELAEEKQALATFTHFHDLHTIIAQREVITFGLFLNFKDPISSGIVSVTPPDLIFEKIMEEISLTAKKQTVLLSVNEKHKKQIKQYLNEHLTPYQEIDEESPFTSGISFYPGIFGEGFSLAEEQIVCYSDKELFHEKVKLGRYHNKFKEAEVLHNYMELEIGDYIVHNQHGIGQYMGIVTRENDGVHKDFLHIIYKGNDELFVPLEQFKLVRKFVSKEGARPKLNKLGSGDWEKTKKRISENIKEQMRAQMKEDENIAYFIDSDIPEMDFAGLTGEESYSFSDSGELVIYFDEYDVAPGYMGAVSFTIPLEVTGQLFQ